MCSFRTLDKEGLMATPEEVKIQEEKFKYMLFLLRSDESRYRQLFEDMRKAYFQEDINIMRP